MSTNLNRRALARGAAWSVPAVAIAAAAPAVAASTPVTPPSLVVAGRVLWNENWDESSDPYNRYDYKIFSSVPGTKTPGQGYCVDNTTASTTITNFTVTYYLPDRNLSFSAGQYGTNGWSMLTRDTSKANKYDSNGYTYYAYTSTYGLPITAVAGSTCLPQFSFLSNGSTSSTSLFFVDNSAVVDGTVLAANYGPIDMNA